MLRAQLAEQYRQSRATAVEMITSSIGPQLDELGLDAGTLSSIFLALTDGLIMQYLIDPEDTPGPSQLLSLYNALAPPA